MNEQKLILSDLASGLSHRASLPMRYSEDFVRSFFKVIEDGLMRDNLVKIKGFGTFKLIGIEARESINVSTGERFEIAGHTKVSFTPDAALRDAVNKPFVEFDTVILNDGTDTALMEATDDDVLAEAVETTEPKVEAPVAEQPQKFVEVPQEEAVEAPQAEEAPVVEAPAEETPAVEAPAEETPVEEAPVEETSVEDIVDEPQDEEDEPEEPQDEEPDDENEEEIEEPINTIAEMEQSNNHNALWLLLTAILFTIIGYCLGYYWHPVALPELCSDKTESTEPVAKPAKADAQPAAVPASSEEGLPADSTATAPASEEQPATDLSAAADYPQLEGGEYVIVGVLAKDTMKVGKMLTKMAIEYYGDKDLYPYICTMNNIDNPDVVPLNMPLLIPKLEKK